MVVVGGGITGAGVALDAASRGLRTALVERDDFASGTSSKSSKLIHGGLRYLQQGEVGLVYEALHERQRLRRNAPHLVRVLPFLIPILTKDGVVSPKIARAMGSAMWGYDVTGGWRIGKFHKRLSSAEALAHVPTLAADRLGAAYLYYDAQADDARLVLTVARTAASLGAAVANRCRVVDVLKGGGGDGVRGVAVEADGQRFELRASVVVNAAGVWSDDVRAMDEGAHPGSIRPAKGVHLTLPWSKVRNDIALVIPVPKDKRSLFVVPWGDFSYVGTTDTDYDGSLDNPTCTSDDVDYVLRAINFSITTGITRADVLGVWAGLRPLVKSATSSRTADLSRRHRVHRSPSGVVTITGGKLTTYREMAADTVDEVCSVLGQRARSHTSRLPLLGADGYVEPVATVGTEVHLARRYGTEAGAVAAIAATDPSLAEHLIAGLPYLKAEVVYAARHEMAGSVDDVLSRRTRARLLARDDSAAAAPAVAALLGAELGWSAQQQAAEVAAYERAIAAERSDGDLPEVALANAFGA